jgi:hypothetical protein
MHERIAGSVQSTKFDFVINPPAHDGVGRSGAGGRHGRPVAAEYADCTNRVPGYGRSGRRRLRREPCETGPAVPLRCMQFFAPRVHRPIRASRSAGSSVFGVETTFFPASCAFTPPSDAMKARPINGASALCDMELLPWNVTSPIRSPRRRVREASVEFLAQVPWRS